jgi:hypothetical protein
MLSGERRAGGRSLRLVPHRSGLTRLKITKITKITALAHRVIFVILGITGFSAQLGNEAWVDSSLGDGNVISSTTVQVRFVERGLGSGVSRWNLGLTGLRWG